MANKAFGASTPCNALSNVSKMPCLRFQPFSSLGNLVAPLPSSSCLFFLNFCVVSGKHLRSLTFLCLLVSFSLAVVLLRSIIIRFETCLQAVYPFTPKIMEETASKHLWNEIMQGISLQEGDKEMIKKTWNIMLSNEE